MSIYSGKCDLCDHIMGTAGWYDKDGNPVKMGEGSGAYYSDEYRDFLEFKKRTGGRHPPLAAPRQAPRCSVS